MKCINDKSELELQTKENVYGHWCNECHGIFLNPREVDVFKYNFESDCLEKAFEDSDSIKTKFVCCHCESLMYKSSLDFSDVIICKSCKSAFLNKDQLSDIKDKQIKTSNIDAGLMGCLPPSLVAIFALFKYFTLDSDSKDKKAYGWIFLFCVILSALFWFDISSYQCGS